MSEVSKSMDKNTAFSRTMKFEFQRRKISKSGPLIMGIMNLTPDSFYSKSRILDTDEIIKTAATMLANGADILDLGAISTRPGSIEVSIDEELNRLIPNLKAILKHIPEAIISIDTFRVETAKLALAEGALIVNDISGGKFDSGMAKFIGENDVPYIMMHIHGTPKDMQAMPLDSETFMQVKHFFEYQTRIFEGFGATQLVLDPGFGFGKTLSANYSLLARISELRCNNYPILVGISRKSMIYNLLNTNADEALNGTTALNTFALLNGADILRVHDVKAAKEALLLCEQLFNSANNKQ